MRSLVETMPRSIRLGLLILTAVVGTWLWLEMDAAMEPAMVTGSADIVDFEFAGSPNAASEILADWGAEGREGAQRAILIDYGFLLTYALFLALASASVAMAALRRGQERVGQVGWCFAGLALLAGVLDAVENTSLLVVINGYETGSISGIATGAAAVVAVPKFAFVIVAGLYLLVIGAYLAVARMRGK